MIVDWAGLGVRIANMAVDVKKAAEENLKKITTYLGVGGVILLIIGAYFLFKKK